MAKLIIEEGFIYRVDGQKLEIGMTLRRFDEVAGAWFEGSVCSVSGYNFEQAQRVAGLALSVEGYAPSPLQEGDIVEIVSRAELYNREMERLDRIAAENRDKPWLPLYDGE